MGKKRRAKSEKKIMSSRQFYRHVPKKNKTDWAGISLGDSFKHNLDYFIRLSAKKKYYSLVRKTLMNVAQFVGKSTASDYKPVIKAQLSPFFTSFPSNLSAFASVGLTAFLEYSELVKQKAIMIAYQKYYEDPALSDELDIDPVSYNEIVTMITETVQTRLNLEDMAREQSLYSVEMYRLFSASHQNMKFRTVSDIVRTIILYGDVLEYDNQELHPMATAILSNVYAESVPFFKRLKDTESKDLIGFGMHWIKSVSAGLVQYLPRNTDGEEDELSDPNSDEFREMSGDFRYSNKENNSQSGKIPPLDNPQAPALTEPLTPREIMSRSYVKDAGKKAKDNSADANATPVEDPIKKKFDEFINTVTKASGQQHQWQDKRSDIIEQESKVFKRGEIEGEMSEGHEVEITLGDNKSATGEIYDRPIELSEDEEAYRKLLEDSNPMTEEMKRQLYPNVLNVPFVENIKTSGSLDPARLAVGDVSEAIFKRYRIHEVADKRGRPVLLIAADGSGSLNYEQMNMLKLLSAAWLRSTMKTEIDVMAGLYHSGTIRNGLSGPLVQWMYHPEKTVAFNRLDAVRSIVTLPDSGTGGQSDALSLAYILQEAKKLAQNRMIYLILITDCAWNVSFRTGLSGQEEVYSLFENLYEDFDDKLHVTMVALGRDYTGFEELLDKVIPISTEELSNTNEVAKKIGVYVASTMRERKKLINKRK